MTRTLILMRHAKSSWDDPRLSDHDRPLNKRGIRSAKALGDWLRAQDLVPDQILCSTARRTVETLELLNVPGAVHLDERLYHATPGGMMAVLGEATAERILMIGHNPGIGDFARRLVKAPPEHERFFDYPTGATLVARFATETWATAGWASGEVEAFVIPRELT